MHGAQGLRDVGDSIVLMGKNTMMKRSIRLYCERTGNETWSNLLDSLVGNVGLIFTKADLAEVSLQCYAHGAIPQWCRHCRRPASGLANTAPLCAKRVTACLVLLHSSALSWRSLTPVRLLQLRDEVAKYKVGAPARVGLVAPNDVIVPGGNTGLDPSQTSFFQVCLDHQDVMLEALPLGCAASNGTLSMGLQCICGESFAALTVLTPHLQPCGQALF